jgi:hypothetical protein
LDLTLRNITAVLALAAALSSCAVYRAEPHATIDEADPFRAFLASKVIGAHRPPESQSHQLGYFLAQLGRGNLFKASGFVHELQEAPDLLIEDFQPSPWSMGEGFQCFEPMLLVLTAGLIPSWCKREEDFSFTLVAPSGAKLTVSRVQFTERSAAGWVMLPLVASDEWSFKEPEARQVYARLKAKEQDVRALFR